MPRWRHRDDQKHLIGPFNVAAWFIEHRHAVWVVERQIEIVRVTCLCGARAQVQKCTMADLVEELVRRIWESDLDEFEDCLSPSFRARRDRA